MRIDAHAHIMPPAFLAEADKRGGIGWPGELPGYEDCLMSMDRYGIRASIISLPVHLDFGGDLGAADVRRLARACNESHAELVRRNPARLAALACLPLPDLDATLDELSHALGTLGLDGVVLLTSYGDGYLGDAAFDPLFDELERRCAYVFVHPAAKENPLGKPFGPFLLELPFETTRAVMNLVLSGTVSRCPHIRFQFAHLGGAAPYLAPRLGELFVRSPELHELAPDGAAALRSLYWDTALSAGPAPLRAALAMTDPERIVFGSDWPFDLSRPPAGSDPAPGLQLLGSDRTAVDQGNALALVPRWAVSK